jgi:hypothetical protein
MLKLRPEGPEVRGGVEDSESESLTHGADLAAREMEGPAWAVASGRSARPTSTIQLLSASNLSAEHPVISNHPSEVPARAG